MLTSCQTVTNPDGTRTSVFSPEVAKEYVDAAAYAADSTGTLVGGGIAGVLTCISSVLAVYVRKNKKEKQAAMNRANIVAAALKATVEGVEAYKNSKDNSKESIEDIRRVNSILKQYQSDCGGEVRGTVREVLDGVKVERIVESHNKSIDSKENVC